MHVHWGYQATVVSQYKRTHIANIDANESLNRWQTVWASSIGRLARGCERGREWAAKTIRTFGIWDAGDGHSRERQVTTQSVSSRQDGHMQRDVQGERAPLARPAGDECVSKVACAKYISGVVLPRYICSRTSAVCTVDFDSVCGTGCTRRLDSIVSRTTTMRTRNTCRIDVGST